MIMSRVSLGVILPGNPDMIQKETTWLKKLEWISTKGFLVVWSLFLIGGIGCIFIRSLAGLAMVMLVPIFVLPCTTLIWNQLSRCPYCKHFFSMKRIGKEHLIDISEREISRTVDDYGTGTAWDWNGNISFFNTKYSYKEHGKKVEEIYTYNMRCSCCGCVNKVKGKRSKEMY